MNSKDFDDLVRRVVQRCIKLKNKYVDEKILPIDWVCIFSQSQREYEDLVAVASTVGEVIERTESGPIFKFTHPPLTAAGKPKVLKIRIPDPNKPEGGDGDFVTDYPTFKEKYLNNKNFTLIKRERFEMIELRDTTFDVLVYFSSIPPSTLQGIS
jgi:hypothetical protein